MASLLSLSGCELARLIRARALSSREVVEAHIARIAAVNPALNALVADRFSAARAEADLADALLARSSREELPPFLGVPCTVKEAIAVAGMPYTSGLVARRGRVAERDATGVARLRAAGAIPLGVTNISELCMWMESNNNVYGRARNPYDQRRIVGGSSGGEAAIVAACGAPFGFGADVGGSIRMPAFFNGVFGHKPTGGLVPVSGHFPMAHGEARRILTAGPLARRAEDLWPLLAVLAGPDGEDAGCVELPLGDPARVRIEELTVLDVADNGAIAVAPELRAAQARAAAALAALGARVESARLEGLRRSFAIWSARMAAAGGPSFGELLGEGRRISVLRHLLRWPFGRTPHTLPALGLAALEKLPALVPRLARRYLDEARVLADEVARLLGPRSVILYPPYPRPAPRHNRPLLAPLAWVYTAIWNALELPATQVPLGLDARGLPLGVQVVGGRGQDHVTIAVAVALERALGGWVPPAALPPLPAFLA
jgi:fatty acid amide hydrolase 2